MAAQPFNLAARLGAPREVDGAVDEFWLDNPFDFERMPFNLSMYERNRFFINRSQGHLLDVSHSSGVDIESDTRGVCIGDLNEDGRPDMVVRNVGGGPLRVFLNDTQGGRSLTVTLRGSRSNRNGIGSRLELRLGERKLYREHWPQNSLMAQNALETIIGLGDHEGPMRLTVRWPSGAVQVLEGVQPGRLCVEETEAE